MEKLPILTGGKQTGELTITPEGLHTRFSARNADTGDIMRLSVYGESEGYLGVMVPDGEGLRLDKKLSKLAMAGFPANPTHAGEAGQGVAAVQAQQTGKAPSVIEKGAEAAEEALKLFDTGLQFIQKEEPEIDLLDAELSFEPEEYTSPEPETSEPITAKKEYAAVIPKQEPKPEPESVIAFKPVPGPAVEAVAPIVKPEPTTAVVAPIVKPEPAPMVVAPVVTPEPAPIVVTPVVTPEQVPIVVTPNVTPEPAHVSSEPTAIVETSVKSEPSPSVVVEINVNNEPTQTAVASPVVNASPVTEFATLQPVAAPAAITQPVVQAEAPVVAAQPAPQPMPTVPVVETKPLPAAISQPEQVAEWQPLPMVAVAAEEQMPDPCAQYDNGDLNANYLRRDEPDCNMDFKLPDPILPRMQTDTQPPQQVLVLPLAEVEAIPMAPNSRPSDILWNREPGGALTSTMDGKRMLALPYNMPRLPMDRLRETRVIEGRTYAVFQIEDGRII